MTMQSEILALLRRGWLSPLMALQEASCLSLAQRCSEFARDGHYIEKRWLKLPNGKQVREYRLGVPPAPTTDEGCYFMFAGQRDRAKL